MYCCPPPSLEHSEAHPTHLISGRGVRPCPPDKGHVPLKVFFLMRSLRVRENYGMEK